MIFTRPLLRIAVPLLACTAVLAAPHLDAQTPRQQRQEKRKEKHEAEAAAKESGGLVRRITTIKQGGGRVDWVGNKIAFDIMGKNDFFEIHEMRPDGSGERCLTCGNPDLPRRNVGQPAWDPSGRWLVMQAEKSVHRPVPFSHVTTPGSGVLNDLWALDTSTNRATLIRDVENAPGHGTLHPHFSADGTMLSWSEMTEKANVMRKGQQFGHWQLMVADFRVAGGRPSLANVRPLSPGGVGFYENHGFSPDGSRLLFTSNFEGRGRTDYDIYSIDLRTQKVTRLTSEGYNEHANYSPDGRYIVWMSNVGAPGGADYWIMNTDGANKRRLTFFNEKGHPEYMGPRTVVADLAWRPDGTAFAAYVGGKVLMESKTDPTKIVLVELNLR